jgi:hypothetical protein
MVFDLQAGNVPIKTGLCRSPAGLMSLSAVIVVLSSGVLHQ